jgi:DNA-binding NarL/FixJ family response regulator
MRIMHLADTAEVFLRQEGLASIDQAEALTEGLLDVDCWQAALDLTSNDAPPVRPQLDAVLVAAGQQSHRRPAPPAGLTARELEILGMLCCGMTPAEIAASLFLARKTVRNHVEHLHQDRCNQPGGYHTIWR